MAIFAAFIAAVLACLLAIIAAAVTAPLGALDEPGGLWRTLSTVSVYLILVAPLLVVVFGVFAAERERR